MGVGLWTMQSTAMAPASATDLYERFADDAALVEDLGFRSIWSAEHRAWYDGWCPALVHAQAFAAARTRRVRFGHAILLVPQHDPLRLARALATLDRLSGGRVDLGAGLGHRDAEFDMVGLRRDRRGRLMDAALDTLAAAWSGENGDAPPAQRPGPPVWVGGMAPQAIARAASRGHGLMLPQTLRPHELRALVDSYRSQAERPGTVGALRDVWIEADARRAGEFRRRVDAHFREEAGSWWVLKGQVGFSQPEQMDRQLARIYDTEVVGAADEVAAGLNQLYAAGVEFLVLRLNFDFVERAELGEQLHALAEDVVPLLEPARGAGGLMRLLLEPGDAGDLDALAAAGEAVRRSGLDGVLIGRTPLVSAPLVAAAALAARVGAIRIAAEVEVGEAHPLEVAEEAAVVDVASGGRLILVATPAPGREERFGEALDLMRTAFAPAPFRFEGTTWRVPANLPANEHNLEERARLTPSPVQPRLELWAAGDGRAAALARGLGFLAGAGDDTADLGRAWEGSAAALGPAAIGAARARREPYDGDPAALVARLREGRAAFGQSWAVVAAPGAAALAISRRARPRVQTDGLPAGLEAHWDATLPR